MAQLYTEPSEWLVQSIGNFNAGTCAGWRLNEVATIRPVIPTYRS